METTTLTVPPACQQWMNAEVDRWRQGEKRAHRNDPTFVGKHADWLDTEGRARFVRFVAEYRIVKPVRFANPVIALTRSYRAARHPRNAYGPIGAHMSTNDPSLLPWVDHPEMWKDADDEVVFTSFPYGCDEADCLVTAQRLGLTVAIRWDLSFYHSATAAVIWTRGAS